MDSFLKKESYDLIVPSVFINRNAGKTIISRQTAKQDLAREIKGRCFTVNQGDLNPGNEDNAYRNFKFVIDEVRGNQALSSLREIRLTSDKKASMIKKWRTLIESHHDISTTDGYGLRVFVNGVTKRRSCYKKKSAYATTGQVKLIRKIMIEVINEEFTGADINKIMKLAMYEKIGKEISKRAAKIYPLQTCLTTKIKVLKRPVIEESE